MKRFVTVFVLLISTVVCTAQTSSIKDLYGKWEAVDSENVSGGLEIVDSTSIYLVYGDEKRKVVTYKADFAKSPVRFDFVLKNGNEDMKLNSLMQFINEDLIQWQVFEGDTQPAYFKENDGNLVYLRRKK